jgi:short-subunit dehydrogenase
VLVVGGSSGLGAALAVLHRARGDDVVAVARRGGRLQELAELSAGDGAGRWESVPLDLLREDAPDLIAGRCDPALVYLVAATGDSSNERDLMTLNFHRPIALARRFEAPGTTVVVISSLVAVIPFPGLAVYCASKAALEAWATAHRERYRGRLIVVRPGRFQSEFFTKAPDLRFDALPWDTAQQVIARTHARKPVVTLGGWRDRVAARLGPIFGGRLLRRVVLRAA